MERREFATLAQALATAYQKEKFLADRQEQELWYEMLKDLPYNMASQAIQHWIATEKWSPTIAEIRKTTASINFSIPDWSEAWERVTRVIRKYGTWDYESAMKELDDLTATCVKRISYHRLCTTENIAVERATFRDIYEREKERRMTTAQLPERLRAITEQTLNRLEKHEEV